MGGGGGGGDVVGVRPRRHGESPLGSFLTPENADMYVAKEHLDQLRRAVQAAEPLLSMPRLHPRYIQALLTEWAEGSPKRQVRLVESHVGSRLLTKVGIKAGTSLDRGQDLKAFMLNAELPLANGWEHIWWLPDLEAEWEDSGTAAIVVSFCREIAIRGLPLRIAIGAPTSEVPPSVRPWMRSIELLTPKAREDGARSFALDVLDHDGLDPRLREGRGRLSEIINSAKASAVVSGLLQGLDAAAINIVIEAASIWALDESERLETAEDDWKTLKSILDQERKRQLRRASGLTVVQPTTESLEGMHRFKRYLEYVSVLFHDHRFERTAHNGPVPRGVLLVGLPGCGKSLAAAVTARKLDVPLLRMDVGAMLGRYLGESEANLRRALDAAEAAAPCVLWVDELEKALGGLGGSEGGGTGLRMLGQLLTWMQEHRSAVYLFATANKVSALPPELLRRGRFDELWCVTLPEPDERRAILHSKLRALGEACDGSLLDRMGKTLADLVHATNGYTGADIASLIQEAWMHASVFSQRVTAEHIKLVMESGFRPMSEQFGETIRSDIEQLKAQGFRNVWCEEAGLPKAVPPDRTGEGGRLPGDLGEIWWADRPLSVVFRGTKRSAQRHDYVVTVRPGSGSERVAQVIQGHRANGTKSKPKQVKLVRDGAALRVEGLVNSSGDPVQARVVHRRGAKFARLEMDGVAYQQREPAQPWLPSKLEIERREPENGQYTNATPWLTWKGSRVKVKVDPATRTPYLLVGRHRTTYVNITYVGKSSFRLQVPPGPWADDQDLSTATLQWAQRDGLSVSGVEIIPGSLGRISGDWPGLASEMLALKTSKRR